MLNIYLTGLGSGKWLTLGAKMCEVMGQYNQKKMLKAAVIKYYDHAKQKEKKVSTYKVFYN